MKISLFAILSLILISAPVMGDGFSIPGVCEGESECFSYCSQPENMEECKTFMESSSQESHAAGISTHNNVDFYNDIDPVEMIIGSIFSNADDMNPKEFIQYCPDAEAMVDVAITELKSRGAWDISSACSQLERDLSMCREQLSHCEDIRNQPALVQPKPGHEGAFSYNSIEDLNNDPNVDVITCDQLNEDILYNNCLEMQEGYLAQQDVDTQCEEEWNRNQAYNKGFCEFGIQESCDKNEFIQSKRDEANQFCENSYSGYGGNDTDNQIDECVENFYDYEQMWEFHSQSCESNREMCDKDAYISSCKERFAEMSSQMSEQSKEMCKQQAEDFLPKLQESCEQNEIYYNQCVEQSKNSCDFMEDAVSQCTDVTEDDIREAMIEQAEKFCGFQSSEGRRVSLRGQDVSELVKHLQDARDEASAANKPVIDESSESLLQIAEETSDAESRGIGRTLKWIVGAAAEEEKADAAKLRESAEKLDNTIVALKLVLQDVENESLKGIVEEQIESLEERVDELEELADKKERRSNGLFSLFG